jgi:hypothetical protein
MQNKKAVLKKVWYTSNRMHGVRLTSQKTVCYMFEVFNCVIL